MGRIDPEDQKLFDEGKYRELCEGYCHEGVTVEYFDKPIYIASVCSGHDCIGGTEEEALKALAQTLLWSGGAC